MATQFTFNGRLIKLPGAYSEVQSGVNNQPLDFSYGNVVIIDKDDTNTFGGGAGITGELESGKAAIYPFDNVRDLQSFIRGGKWYDNVVPMFRPFGSGADGVSKIYYIKAFTTVAATQTLTWTGGGADGGVLKFQSRHEGLAGNGVEVTSKLTRGLSIVMEASPVTAGKYLLKFYRGTFTGNDADGLAYNEIAEASTEPELIAKSPDFDNVQEIIDWATTNASLNDNVKLDTANSSVAGTGAVDAADLAATTGNQLFASGTQVYATAQIDEILDSIKDLDYTFITTLDSGSDATSVDNLKILSHLDDEAKYEKFLFVAGGDDINSFESESIASAVTYNSDKVNLVHGGVYITSNTTGTGLKERDATYKTAHVIGRTCGLAPQIPITFKGLGYAGEVHDMKDSEKEHALDNGVITSGFDGELGFFAITQGINTLQRNSYLVNEDGTSHLISIKRISAQLNKEIEINSKVQLLGKQSVGPNLATLSPAIVENWTKNFLQRKTATATEDNLILGFQDITATINQDSISVRYAFKSNTEVNKIFFTGIILDPSVQL